MEKNAENIQVMVRCRPLNEREKKEGAKECIVLDEYNPKYIYLGTKNDQKKFVFDFVGGYTTTQEDIFRLAGKPLTLATLEGYNSCIFAYGQTGAGKTFTMQGRGLEKESEDSALRGLQPRVFDFLFGVTQQEIKESQGSVEYLISASYLEIYNEQIRDLLSHTNANLMVREDLKKGVYIEGLLEEPVKSSEDTIDLLRKGMRNRHVGATNMNADSSRSHCVFSMTIMSKKSRDGMSNVTSSKLHFVDLAGSERQKQTAAAGERLKEATNINKSLTTLGLVINSLVEIANGKQRHIPYRDSKLTFLLKDSLGGNSRTYMIAAVSVASTSFQETMSTLKFAQRAKMIKNKALINEEASGSVESLKKEIRRLKDEILGYQKIIGELQEDQENNKNKMEEEIMLSGKKSKGGKQLVDPVLQEETQQQIQIMTQKYIELEEYFKNQLENLRESDLEMQTELDKRTFDLQQFVSAREYYEQNELQYKQIIYLYDERIGRYFDFCHIANQKRQDLLQLNSEEQWAQQVQQFLANDYNQLQQQYQAMLRIVQTLENVVTVTYENYELKQIVDGYEGEVNNNPTSTRAVTESISQNITYINELCRKLDDNIEERKALDQAVDRANLFKLPTPEKVMYFEEQISQLKIQQNQQLEKLNFEILTMKQRELAQEKQIELQRKKNKDLNEDILKEKEKMVKDSQQYERRINEMLHNFEKIENQKAQSQTDHQKKISKLNLRVLEFETQTSAQQQRIVEMEQELQEKSKLSAKQVQEMEINLQDQENRIEELFGEKQQLEAHTSTLERNIEILQGDLEQVKKEAMELQQKSQKNQEENDNYKQNIEVLLEEKRQLNDRVQKVQSEKEGEIWNLKQKLNSEEEKYEEIESEKNKVQEQLDTIQDTFNFQQEEMEDNRKKMQELTEKNEEIEKKYQEVQEKYAKGNQEVDELKQEILEKSGENLAAKENQKLVGNMHELKIQLENESKQNYGLRSQLNQMNSKISDLQQSEEHFRSAYLEIRNQLQGLVQKNKDLQQALSTKEMEHYELQRDMKSSNENVYFLQERICQLKDESKNQRSVSQQDDQSQKLVREKVQLLQQSLQTKMNELQQILAQKSELQKQLVKIQNENEELKQFGSYKTVQSDKKVQEILSTYQRQCKENKDLQKTLNAKIQENLGLTASIKVLQNVVEKQANKNAELEHSKTNNFQNIEQENKQVRGRLDRAISEIQQLEMEQVQILQDWEQNKQHQSHTQQQQNGGNSSSDNKKIKEQLESFRQQIKEKDKKEKETQKYISEIAQNLEEYKRDSENQKQELMEKGAIIEKKYNKKKEHVFQLEEHVKKLEQEMKNLKIQNQQLEQNNMNNQENQNNTNNNNMQQKKNSDSKKEKEELMKLKEELTVLQKDKNDSRKKIADLNKIILQNENINLGGNGNQQQNQFIETEICSMASKIKSNIQGISKHLLRQLPQFQEMDFPENFAFLSPAIDKLFDYLKDKEKKIGLLSKEIDNKSVEISKLTKEKQAVVKKYGLSQTQINGLMTPTPRSRMQMEQQQQSAQQNQQQQQQQQLLQQQQDFAIPQTSSFKAPSAQKQTYFQKQMQYYNHQKQMNKISTQKEQQQNNGNNNNVSQQQQQLQQQQQMLQSQMARQSASKMSLQKQQMMIQQQQDYIEMQYSNLKKKQRSHM